MREILFRGKRTDNGEWIYGDLRQDKDLETAYIGGWDYYTADYAIQREPFEYPVYPETVGQYTGLTDKNGTRIFEGDVMEFTAYGEHYKGVVYIYKGNFGIFCKPPSAHCEASPFLDDAIEKHNAVVIGNVHDNPDLLEVKRDGN